MSGMFQKVKELSRKDFFDACFKDIYEFFRQFG